MMLSFSKTGSLVALAILTGMGGLKPAEAQSNQFLEENIIQIGGSPEEWNFFSSYWQRLINLNTSQPSGEEIENASSQEETEKKLAKNIRVRQLRQDYILKLNGSSQISGQVTNRNDEAVIVQSVNYELQDARGQIIQTGSAVPTPNVLAPGQTATFSQTLLTAPVDTKNKIKLSKPGVIVRQVN